MTRILFVGNPTGKAILIAERLRAEGHEVEIVSGLSEITNVDGNMHIIGMDEALGFGPDVWEMNRQFSAITLTAHDMNKRPRKGKGQRKANRAERWL